MRFLHAADAANALDAADTAKALDGKKILRMNVTKFKTKRERAIEKDGFKNLEANFYDEEIIQLFSNFITVKS